VHCILKDLIRILAKKNIQISVEKMGNAETFGKKSRWSDNSLVPLVAAF